MRCRVGKRCLLLGIVFGLSLAWSVNGACGAPGKKPLPKFAQVKRAVERYLAAMRDYQPGDLITRGDIQPLFARLKRLGWSVADQKDILNRLPADGDFLVQQLRTRRGRKFMRQIGSFPDTYDRLKRLSKLPHGKRTVHELIQRSGKGAEVIKYLASDADGIRASKQMSRKVSGAGFNKPTGRIYTAKMLLDRLEKSHQAARQREASPGK